MIRISGEGVLLEYLLKYAGNDGVIGFYLKSDAVKSAASSRPF